MADGATGSRAGRRHEAAGKFSATGVRRGEALALRWRNVDLERAIFGVVESSEQTGTGLRRAISLRTVSSRASRFGSTYSPVPKARSNRRDSRSASLRVPRTVAVAVLRRISNAPGERSRICSVPGWRRLDGPRGRRAAPRGVSALDELQRRAQSRGWTYRMVRERGWARRCGGDAVPAISASRFSPGSGSTTDSLRHC
jgi:hypothetical protein